MKDSVFERKIKKCRDYFDKYQILLQELELEYERRFGANPSDVDDEWWIDTMHYGQGDIDFKEVLKEAKRSTEN